MNIAQTIQKTPFFKGMEVSVIEEMTDRCHQRTYTKGRQLFQKGDKADSFFIIIQGWVKIFRMSRAGEEAVINVFGPGESFAEAAVFGDKRSYPVSAQTTTDVELVEVPRIFFIQKIEEDSRFALRILAAISSHQHYLVGQIEQVTTRTAPQRVGAFLLQFCNSKNNKDGAIVIDLPYDKSLISNRLNIKPETFSRALIKLKPYGVKTRKHEILIQNIKQLEEFCDVSLS